MIGFRALSFFGHQILESFIQQVDSPVRGISPIPLTRPRWRPKLQILTYVATTSSLADTL